MENNEWSTEENIVAIKMATHPDCVLNAVKDIYDVLENKYNRAECLVAACAFIASTGLSSMSNDPVRIVTIAATIMLEIINADKMKQHGGSN
jgi:hypothetical protein